MSRTGGAGQQVDAVVPEEFQTLVRQLDRRPGVTRQSESLAFSRPVPLFPIGGDSGLGPSYDVVTDGQSFLTFRSEAAAQISVVFNWPQELARLEAENR